MKNIASFLNKTQIPFACRSIYNILLYCNSFLHSYSLKADLAKVTSEKKSAEENANKEKSSLSQLKAQLLELEDEFTKVKDTYEARVNDLQKKLQESLEETGKLDKDKQNLMTRYSQREEGVWVGVGVGGQSIINRK